MGEKLFTIAFCWAISAYCGYVTVTGWKEGVLSYKGQDFPRAEKPFFFWALMFMSALFTLGAFGAGIEGIGKLMRHS